MKKKKDKKNNFVESALQKANQMKKEGVISGVVKKKGGKNGQKKDRC